MTTMRTAKQSDGWWILDVPRYCVNGETCTSCGPYATKAEAEDGRRGLERFYRANPEILTGRTAKGSGD